MCTYSKKKIAVVTGGGKWIGAGICASLCKAGYRVLAVGRHEEALKEMAEKYADERDVEVLVADVRSSGGRDKIISTCIERFGRIDILVNNAATTYVDALLDYSQEGWDNVMKTNLTAPFYLSLAAMDDMRKRHWGRIVNITSVYGSISLNNEFYPNSIPDHSVGDRGPLRACAYHASKGGLINLTRELAVAGGQWGITVNAVSPGMMPNSNKDDSLVYDAEIFKKFTPLKMVGQPKHIGQAVCYFVSDAADFTTGAELVIDGGWSIW